MEKDEKIRWQDWSGEVFSRSREEKKPVFLSISATWCHWCHVMDEEGFDHPEVIRRLNRDFIPVRVDSDKRPDINSRYNMGGWPTVAILDAEGGVRTGGTYLPTSQLLEMLSGIRPGVPATAPEPLSEGGKIAPVPKRKAAPGDVDVVLSRVERAFDRDYGGFGPPPKFPHPWILELIIKNRQRVEDPKWRRMASLTLDVMRQSELYDREDGGFFRYSTRGDWDRPHYEKLLETNARMLPVYLDAYRILKEPVYKATALGILDYLQTTLSNTEGPGFFGSQSADEEYYRLSEEARLNSPPPPLDKTVYSDLNAETASALMKAGVILEDPGLQASAIELADFLWEDRGDPEYGMRHSDREASSLRGYLSDQVRMLTLLLDAHEMEGERRFLDRALVLLETMTRNLWDEESGGYRDLPAGPDREGLLKKEMKPLTENSLAVLALTRLFYLMGDDAFLKRAERTLGFLSGIFEPYKHHAAVFAIALERFLNVPDTVVITGFRKDENWRDLLRVANRMNPSHTPFWRVVIPLDNKDDSQRMEKMGYRAMDKAAATLCRGRTCRPPVHDPGDLEELLVPAP